MLHLSLGGSHGRGLCSSRNGIKFCFFCTAVHKNKADVGLVCCHGAHACIQIDVVIDSHVIVAIGSAAHISLAEDRVDISMLESAVVIQLAD